MEFGRIIDPEAWKQAMAGLLRKGGEVGEYIEQAPQKAGQAITEAGQRQSALMNKAFDPTGNTLIRDPQAANQAAMNLFEGPLSVAPVGMTKLEDVVNPIIKKGIELDIYQSKNNPNNLILSKIAVPKEQRGMGLGTEAMNNLAKFADAEGKTIALTPDTVYGATSKNRLKDFYKELGFVENKGKNKDYSISEGMYRSPVKVTRQEQLLKAFDEQSLTPIYHGTSPESAKAINKSGFDVTKSADGTIWFTSNPNIGEVAATGKGAVIKKMLDEKSMKLGGWDEIDKYSVNELLQKGYDGVKLKDSEGITYQIFNPEKLK